jgi:hypothetical protein|tara:strand:+ start:177 stop:317 length:141 start_codon:yes stop_codon:yes gene_type:complete
VNDVLESVLDFVGQELQEVEQDGNQIILIFEEGELIIDYSDVSKLN